MIATKASGTIRIAHAIAMTITVVARCSIIAPCADLLLVVVMYGRLLLCLLDDHITMSCHAFECGCIIRLDRDLMLLLLLQLLVQLLLN